MSSSRTTFAASVDSARGLLSREAADPHLNPDCHSILLSHAEPTPRAVVFLHGITSSPVQFRDLGALFHSRGYNVLIPRLPRHGYRDRLSVEHARLTKADYQAHTAEAIHIGRGLGEHLTVAGLSVSGVLAAWAAQTRADVDLAVLIAAAFAPFGVPLPVVPPLARLVRAIPNRFVWWDPIKRAATGPACGYPRFSTHAMAEAFLLGQDVYRLARTTPPAASAVLSITHVGDRAVNNSATRAVVKRWRAHVGARTIREYEFGRLGALHDIIGPYQEHARVDYVYPILFDLIHTDGVAADQRA